MGSVRSVSSRLPRSTIQTQINPQSQPTTTPVRGAVASRRKRSVRALAAESGQGTVEYVGLLLLMATVLAGVVAAATELGGKDQIGKEVVTQVNKAIVKAGDGKAK